MMHWLNHVLGLDDASGHWYLAWSGFVGDLTFVGAAVTFWRRHNCHESWCFRMGKHVHEGTPWCHRHHPKGVVTKESER